MVNTVNSYSFCFTKSETWLTELTVILFCFTKSETWLTQLTVILFVKQKVKNQ